MNQEDIVTKLIMFKSSKRQLLVTLDLLMNDNKRIQHTPFDTRHIIGESAYFCIIHEFNLIYHQSTRMDRNSMPPTFNYYLTSNEGIVDLEEMIDMFLYVLAHDIKNRVIQREFVRFEYPWCIRWHIHKASWEGSLTNSCILRDAISRSNRLKVSKDNNYGITTDAMLGTPTLRVSWLHTEDKDTTYRSGVVRSIQSVEGSLGNPSRKVTLPSPSPMLHDNGVLLLHNLINREMTNADMAKNYTEGDSTYAITLGDDIHYIETSNECSQWSDDLAEEMLSEWELCNQ
ncbi:putative nuclease HARBI1 [Cucumis melo var. makuwa]|uniref:Putative nuclease HARBI1 n=1 Tax=Cucumis melo var. makuwa TaxID=1194695 RepID=A0A5D3C145_CUCMM|nr:putative nuclease HARBI1 [Cucumis melo var. makuwa]